MTDPLPPRWPLVAFLAAVAVNVGADAVGSYWLTTASKPFIVGSLLVWVVLASGRRPPRPLVVGLVAALAGDVLLSLPGTPAFLAGMAAFLVMQVCYVVGFTGLGSLGWFRSHLAVALGWALLWLSLNVALGPRLGVLAVPVAVYSAALVSMAASGVATRVRPIAVGAVLFLVSDLLIGLRSAGVDVPFSGVLVMATYSAAQYLIATGWVRALATGRSTVATG